MHCRRLANVGMRSTASLALALPAGQLDTLEISRQPLTPLALPANGFAAQFRLTNLCVHIEIKA